ncbi:hypothetical protein ACFLV5_01010 [Chloroflexota bacterium]
MENIADFSIWIKQLSSEVENQTVAVMELAVSFADGEQWQARSDQAVSLRILKSRVMKEVEDIRQMESAAQSRDNNITLFGKSPAAFIFNSLFTAGTFHKDAFKAGVRLAGSVLSKTVPFGTVLIAIGKEGFPEDLKILHISRFARESNKAEPEIETSWKHDGYLLMTPEQFAELLDKVGREILNGSASLPMTVDKLILLIT